MLGEKDLERIVRRIGRIGFVVGIIAGLAGVPAASIAQTGSVCEAATYGLSASLVDNSTAFNAALHACGGRTLHLPAGTYKFAPAQFIRGFVVPNATSIVGDGAGATTLEIAGPGNYDSFFWIRDVSNVSIRGLTLRGNGVFYQAGSCVYDYGKAISIVSSAGQVIPVTNITIASNLLTNFVGTGWISMLAAAGSAGIGTIPAGANITIEGNFFQSLQGNSVAPGNPDCNSAGVEIFGAGTAVNVTNVSVSGNGFDASYLKQGIIVYGSASQITIAANSISGAGQKLASPKDSSLYGILVYQKSTPPNVVNIVGNSILDPFSCGVYVAAGRNITISGNTISGQVDTNDGIEPKGAICLNHVDNGQDGETATIMRNTISSSQVGISIAEGSVPNVRQNSISLIPSGGVGIKIASDPATRVSLIDNSISTQATNVSSLVGLNLPSSVTITDLFETGAAYPMRWYRDASGAAPFCEFGEVGSIRNVYQRQSASQGFTSQERFFPGCN